MIYKFINLIINKMMKNIAKYLLFFVIFLKIKCDQTIKTDNLSEYLLVKQTIMEHASYYNESINNTAANITTTFIDFYAYRYYFMDMYRINPNTSALMFEFFLDNKFTYRKDEVKNLKEAYISIKCTTDPKYYQRCNKIYLNEHKYISFDFDFLITKSGGVISFLLILVGLFCLRNGYVYFNITTAFYSGFSFFLFWREYCELNEMNHYLNTLDEKSKEFFLAVYILSLITSVFYGYICIKTKYLKYISFGFIDGLIFAKVLYYLILIGLKKNHKVFLGYLLIEILSCLCFIIFFILFRNKNFMVSIANISILSSYGILYGLHVLIGGMPFLPFFVLSKTEFHPYKLEKDLYEKLRSGNGIAIYSPIFAVIAIIGFYFNYSSYKLFIEKKKKNISTL